MWTKRTKWNCTKNIYCGKSENIVKEIGCATQVIRHLMDIYLLEGYKLCICILPIFIIAFLWKKLNTPQKICVTYIMHKQKKKIVKNIKHKNNWRKMKLFWIQEERQLLVKGKLSENFLLKHALSKNDRCT